MPDPRDDNIIHLKIEELTTDDILIDTTIEEDGGIAKVEEKYRHNVLVHLSLILTGWLTGMPFIGPLLGWVILKNAHPNSMAHVKESLNFAITIFLLIIIAIPFFGMGLLLYMGGGPNTPPSIWTRLFGVSVIWLVIVYLSSLIMPLLAAYKASRGGFFRYPLTIRFIK